MNPVDKMAEALDPLQRHTNNPSRAECLPLLDRMRGSCDQDPAPALTTLPGFRFVQDRRIRRPVKGHFQAYGRARWFHSTRDDTKISIESERQERFLSPYRLTLFADDLTGLLPRDVLSVLELIPDFRLTMIELALDFPGMLDRKKVRRHGLFGKAHPAPTVKDTGYFGTRKGMKLARFYYKRPVQAFRTEFEMPSRFLQYYGVRDVFAFHKLAKILPSRHIYFGTLNERKLVSRLARMRLSAKQRREIMQMVALMDGDLWPILNFLRNDVQMTNTRRLVDPLPINQIIADELSKWAAMWPKRPTKLLAYKLSGS